MKFLTITAGCVLTAFTCLFLSRKLIHLYQLENYQLPGFFKSVRRSLKKTLRRSSMRKRIPWRASRLMLPT